MKIFNLLDSFTNKVIGERRNNAKSKCSHDFISLMMNAEDPITKSKLSDSDIRSNSRLFLAAGHDTTATTLTMFLYHVARNPHVEKSILEEIDGLNGGEMIDHTVAQKHEYLGWALSGKLSMRTVTLQCGIVNIIELAMGARVDRLWSQNQ